MPVKLTFCMMNTLFLVWFIMTSWKESQWLFMWAETTSERFDWAVPSLIPLLNHSVLRSKARRYSFYLVRLKCLKKICSFSSFQHIWIEVTGKYTESITDGLLWKRAGKHVKGMNTESVFQQWIMECESKAKLLPVCNKKKKQPSISQIWCKMKSLIHLPSAEPLSCSIWYMNGLH